MRVLDLVGQVLGVALQIDVFLIQNFLYGGVVVFDAALAVGVEVVGVDSGGGGGEFYFGAGYFPDATFDQLGMEVGLVCFLGSPGVEGLEVLFLDELLEVEGDEEVERPLGVVGLLEGGLVLQVHRLILKVYIRPVVQKYGIANDHL